MIAALHAGRTDEFAASLAEVLKGLRTLDLPAHMALECRDRLHYRDPLQADDDPLDQSSSGICGDWSLPGPPPVIPAGTEIPPIVLAGQFDPNASPALSRHIAELIGPHARWIEFPLIGHNVAHFSACAMGIVAGFIARPTETPDTSCADRAPPIRFLASTPRTAETPTRPQ